MTFAHPMLLLLAILPLGWTIYVSRRAARPLQIWLKGASLIAICVAFAEPAITFPQQRTGAVVLVDTSASITQEDLCRAAATESELARN